MSLPAPRFPASVLQTLRPIADALTSAQDPWWLIGGAAAMLHGLDQDIPVDIDVLLSPRDAVQVAAALRLPLVADGGTSLFRSEIFSRWLGPPLVVEFMGGLEISTQEGWKPVWPETREAVPVDERVLFVPHREELARIFRMMGRPKDIRRAAALSGQP